MRRLAIFLALALAPACNCGKQPHINTTSGIVVLSDGTTVVTESDLALNFGSVCLASSGVAPTVASFFIENSGENTLGIKSIALSGTDASSFSITTSPLPTSVAPGAKAQVDVAFAPKDAVNESAAVVIDTDDPNKPEVNVRLLGSGAQKPAQPTYLTSCAEPDGGATDGPGCSTLDFSGTEIGATSSQVLHIANNGCPPLQITGVSFDGSLPDGGAAFHLHSAPSFPISIASGATTDLQVDFAPTSIDDSYGDLYVTTNGVPDPSGGHVGFLQDGGDLPANIFYVALSGTPLQASISLEPSACTFALDAGPANACRPVVVGGGPALAAQFLLTNSGNEAVQVTSVSVPADDAGAFSISTPNATPFTIDASGGANPTVPITVTYHPFNGILGEDLVVVTSAGTLRSHLIGGNPAIISVPATLDFNDTPGDASTFSSPRDLAVQNAGGSPLRIGSFAFTQQLPDGGDGQAPCTFDADAGPVARFALLAPDGGNFPLTVAPGDTSTWSIAYQPDRLGGTRECDLHIASNDPGTPDATVSVSATTFINCAPVAVISPDDLSDPSGITLSATVDGGAYPISGASSYDPPDPRGIGMQTCPNGQSNGLQFFDWKLASEDPTFPFASRLESAAANQSCLESTSDGGCDELRITQVRDTFFPYDAPQVNVLVSSSDDGHPLTLKLTVTDTTGNRSSADSLTINPAP